MHTGKLRQIRKNCFGQASREVIGVQDELLEVDEIGQADWHGAAEPVVREVQTPQSEQRAQCGRNGACGGVHRAPEASVTTARHPKQVRRSINYS